jgi:hypothetical protein
VLLSPALNDDQHPWQEKKSMADDGELYPMWNLQKEKLFIKRRPAV